MTTSKYKDHFNRLLPNFYRSFQQKKKKNVYFAQKNVNLAENLKTKMALLTKCIQKWHHITFGLTLFYDLKEISKIYSKNVTFPTRVGFEKQNITKILS